MSQIHNAQEMGLIALLEGIRKVPERNPGKAALGREKYQSNVKVLIGTRPVHVTVSGSLLERLKDRITMIADSIPIGKERFSMLTTLSTILVVISLVLGGAGATVYASQGSLPDSVLYPLKTLSEQARLALTTQKQTQLKLSMEFANRRIDEAAAMDMAGDAISPEIANRLQEHLEFALQLAAGMEEGDMREALAQIRASLQQQELVMDGLGVRMGQDDPTLVRIREMLRTQIGLCEMGLENPVLFRQQLQQRSNLGQKPPGGSPDEPPANGGNQVSPGPGPNTAPVGTDTPPITDPNTIPGAGSGPNADPGSGQGSDPGPGQCSDCNPVQDGSGPGPGPGESPGNGSGSGPGAGDCPNYDPPQDGSGSGPGPNNGPGG